MKRRRNPYRKSRRTFADVLERFRAEHPATPVTPEQDAAVLSATKADSVVMSGCGHCRKKVPATDCLREKRDDGGTRVICTSCSKHRAAAMRGVIQRRTALSKHG